MAEMFVIPAFCDSCGAPMVSGVPLGVPRSTLPAGHPSFPCPTCFLGTGRIVTGAYSALVEAARVLRHGSTDGIAGLIALLDLQIGLGGRPSPYLLHPFPPGSAERHFLEMVPWERPEIRNVLELTRSMLRWWTAPDAPLTLDRYAGGGHDPDGTLQRMVEDYVAVRLDRPSPPAAGDEGPVVEAPHEGTAGRLATVLDFGGRSPAASGAATDDTDDDAPPDPPRSVAAEVGGTPDYARVVLAHHEVGRNQPCTCGSGKKYKFCHG